LLDISVNRLIAKRQRAFAAKQVHGHALNGAHVDEVVADFRIVKYLLGRTLRVPVFSPSSRSLCWKRCE
jgi:hypothetical protein